MRLLAKADILENSKRHKAGTAFETDDATGLVLVNYGFAEELAAMPVKEKPKKKAKK